MSDVNTATDNAAPIVTNPPPSPAVAAAVAAATSPSGLAAHPVVAQVVQTAYAANPNSAAMAANAAANALNVIATYAPAVLQLTRASPTTSAWAGIGIEALASLIAVFFPHPAA